MPPQTALIPYLLGFFFFGVGLFAASQHILSKQPITTKSLFGNTIIDNRPMRFVIGIILFSGLCNAILLAPTAAELVFILDSSTSLIFHKAAITILSGSVLLLAAIGAVISLRELHPSASPRLKRIAMTAFDIQILRHTRSQIIFIAIASAAYFYNTLQPKYIYDTGLYHLPLVNHLARYGIEIGVANLHSRFGFYNIQLFGQAPLQALAPNNISISPSLNVLFFAGFLMFAYTSIKGAMLDSSINKPSAMEKRSRNIRAISVISYWATMLIFGLTTDLSLVSLDSDFSTAIIASITIFCLLSGTFHSAENLILLACLPLLKLSGVIPVVFVSIFLLLLALTNILRKTDAPVDFSAKKLLQSISKLKGPPSALILTLYLIFFATNLTTSGYLVFPQYQTGPIGSHSVPYSEVVELKDRWITGWARFRFDAEPRDIAGPRDVIANANFGEWLPQFSRSRQGRTILSWVGYSFFLAYCSACGLLNKRNSEQYRILFASSGAAGTTAILILCFLPPDPRFYHWLYGIVPFNSLQLLILSPMAGMAALAILTVADAAISGVHIAKIQTPRLERLPFKPEKAASPWKARSTKRDQSITFNHPVQGDQCWTAPPPCSPSR